MSNAEVRYSHVIAVKPTRDESINHLATQDHCARAQGPAGVWHSLCSLKASDLPGRWRERQGIVRAQCKTDAIRAEWCPTVCTGDGHSEQARPVLRVVTHSLPPRFSPTIPTLPVGTTLPLFTVIHFPSSFFPVTCFPQNFYSRKRWHQLQRHQSHEPSRQKNYKSKPNESTKQHHPTSNQTLSCAKDPQLFGWPFLQKKKKKKTRKWESVREVLKLYYW